MNVSADTRTSSSGLTPATRSAMCRADVPLAAATPKRVLTKSATSRSNRSTKGPTDETHPVSRHSLTYAHSFPRISGTDRGMSSFSRNDGPLDAEFIRTVPLQVLAYPIDRKFQAFLQADPWLPAE